MADLTVTATSVVPVTGYTFEDGIAGATITAGQTVYKDTSDSNKFKLADADAATTAECYGIALNGCASGQVVKVQVGGELNVGATLTVGQVYVVSTTAGGIAPYADLASGDYVSILGVADTTSNLVLRLFNTGVAKP